MSANKPYTNESAAGQGSEYPSNKVFVCKYVGTPGTDERLQTGDNPISVSVNAIPVDPVYIGAEFADKHGKSVVIAWDEGQPEPSVDECPAPTTSTTTTTGSTTTTTVDQTTTTTTTDPSTTSTTASDSTTTTLSDGTSSTTSTEVTVVGRSATPFHTEGLPVTGVDSVALALLGVVLISVGLASRAEARLWASKNG